MALAAAPQYQQQFTGLAGGMSPFKEGGPSFQKPKGKGSLGSGMYNVQDAFRGWTAPARYSLGAADDFMRESQPTLDYFRDEMGRDYEGDLYGRSSDIYDAQQKDASRRSRQALAQAGYGGGGTVSPFAALQVQQEAAARAGVLGSAAREAVFNAQQMKNEATRNYQNTLTSRLQAALIPAHLQAAKSSRVPTGGMGPGLWGPALQALGNFAGAAAG